MSPDGISRVALQKALLAALEPEPGVAAAYLFGSWASGRAGPSSDIDIAVLVAPGEDDLEICGRLTDAVCRTLRTDRVDVVSLRRAAPPLRFRVIRDGVLVLSRDPAAREAFTVAAVMAYLDFQPLRRQAFALMRERILAES